jgi:hypothetical protein
MGKIADAWKHLKESAGRDINIPMDATPEQLADLYYKNKEYVVWREEGLVTIAGHLKTPSSVLKDMMQYEQSPTMQILVSRQHIASVAAENLSRREKREYDDQQESKMREMFKKFMAEEQGKNVGDIDKMFDEWKKGKEKI